MVVETTLARQQCSLRWHWAQGVTPCTAAALAAVGSTPRAPICHILRMPIALLGSLQLVGQC